MWQTIMLILLAISVMANVRMLAELLSAQEPPEDEDEDADSWF